ncbi:hypothetical protein [Pseudomonas sp. NPDC089396]|uniref:hypothetical protein n=1 Tax=Pseudomonas sp. NPDC089396 TaxID=3364461 RepID=UPI0038345546
MIDITGWPVMAKLIFLLSPFVIGIPGVAMSAYTTMTKDYHVVCSAITSSPYFEAVKAAWGSGSFKWRWMVICTASGLVAFPWYPARRGMLDLDELKAFPTHLKKRLVISAWLSMSGFIWLMTAWAMFDFK